VSTDLSSYVFSCCKVKQQLLDCMTVKLAGLVLPQRVLANMPSSTRCISTEPAAGVGGAAAFVVTATVMYAVRLV
jgi:hypothetical protein